MLSFIFSSCCLCLKRCCLLYGSAEFLDVLLLLLESCVRGRWQSFSSTWGESPRDVKWLCSLVSSSRLQDRPSNPDLTVPGSADFWFLPPHRSYRTVVRGHWWGQESRLIGCRREGPGKTWSPSPSPSYSSCPSWPPRHRLSSVQQHLCPHLGNIAHVWPLFLHLCCLFP